MGFREISLGSLLRTVSDRSPPGRQISGLLFKNWNPGSGTRSATGLALAGKTGWDISLDRDRCLSPGNCPRFPQIL